MTHDQMIFLARVMGMCAENICCAAQNPPCSNSSYGCDDVHEFIDYEIEREKAERGPETKPDYYWVLEHNAVGTYLCITTDPDLRPVGFVAEPNGGSRFETEQQALDMAKNLNLWKVLTPRAVYGNQPR